MPGSLGEAKVGEMVASSHDDSDHICTHSVPTCCGSPRLRHPLLRHDEHHPNSDPTYPLPYLLYPNFNLHTSIAPACCAQTASCVQTNWLSC